MIGDEIEGKNLGDDGFYRGEIKPPIEKGEIYKVLFDDTSVPTLTD
jgi:hypothetical protein